MTDLDAEKKAILLLQPPEEKPADPQETNKRHRHEPQDHNEPRNNHGDRYNNREEDTHNGNWNQHYYQNNQRRAQHPPGRGYPPRRHMPTTPCKGIVDNVDPTKKYFFITLIQIAEGNASSNTSSRLFFHMDCMTQAQQQHRFADGEVVRVIECAHTPKGIKVIRIEIID